MRTHDRFNKHFYPCRISHTRTSQTNNHYVSHPEPEEDSLLNFSRDVEHVLHELRGLEYDPDLPPHLVGRNNHTLSYSRTWTLDMWEVHNSRSRYLRYVRNLPSSRLLRRIRPQMMVLLLWTLITIVINRDERLQFLKGVSQGRGLAVVPKIPISGLGTVSTFVAFLLTLRSNHGLSRLDEARRLWSKMILNTREMANLIASFVYPVDPALALMLTRHVAIFGWLLKSQLRFTRKEDVVDIVRTMLPSKYGYKADADYLLSQRQKTVAVVTRIRQVIAYLGKQHKLTTAEEMALDHTAHALSETITSTGRIRASPIPTLYTSHTSRLLIFYLLCLPPALHVSGTLTPGTTTLLTMVLGFAMIGLDEISHLFEQPFRVLPMYQMSKRSMRAVADALTCRPPRLKGEKVDESPDAWTQKELTTYWTTEEQSVGSDNLME